MIIRNDNITEASLGLSVGDADAQTYINRVLAYESVPVEKANALNDFFIALKANGIWSKIRVMFPMIGSITETHFLEATGNFRYNNLFTDMVLFGESVVTYSDANGLAGPTTNYTAKLNTNNSTAVLFGNGKNDAHYAFYSQNGANAYYLSNFGGADNDGVVITSGMDFITEDTTYRFGSINSEGNRINSGKGLFIARRTTSPTGLSGKIFLNQNGTLLDSLDEDVSSQGDTLGVDDVKFLYSQSTPARSSYFSLGYYMNDSMMSLYTDLIEDLQVKLGRGQA
jgi:hypothetical protein